MLASVDAGETMKWLGDDGVEYFARKRAEACHKVGGASVTKIGGKQQITQAIADEAVKQLQTLQIKLFDAKSIKAIDDIGEMTDKTKETMTRKRDAAHKCLKDGEEMAKLYGQPIMKQLSDSDGDKSRLMSAITELRTAVLPIEQILMEAACGAIQRPTEGRRSDLIAVSMVEMMAKVKTLYECNEYTKMMATRLNKAANERARYRTSG